MTLSASLAQAPIVAKPSATTWRQVVSVAQTLKYRPTVPKREGRQPQSTRGDGEMPAIRATHRRLQPWTCSGVAAGEGCFWGGRMRRRRTLGAPAAQCLITLCLLCLFVTPETKPSHLPWPRWKDASVETCGTRMSGLSTMA